VTLPSSFENAYIGESFSCCLSANNSTPFDLTDVLISAEIETPSVTVPLDLVLPPEVNPDETALKAGDSFQRILRYDLKEEGKYVLAVTVTYTEPPKPNIPTTRSRTFRKLYQFVAQQCLMVRTKAGRLSNGNAVLEAQVENVGEAPVTLENINLLARNGWNPLPVGDNTKGSFLREKEVLQVAFYLLAEKGYVGDKTVLGQLEIEWRAMGGDKGQLTTGNLGIRRLPGS
jgi:trafficking protein particle complex subunit 13